MIGNLTERNCSTVFYNIMMNHSDPYYFRLQMEPDVFKATFNTNPNNASDSSKTVRINVIDSPQPPELIFSPDVSKYVMEGTAVNLICSAEAPCPKQPPTLSWTNIPKSANIITQLQEKPDKTHSVFSSMTFNASYMDHRMNISCTATYPRNISNNTTVNSTVMLQVSFPPKETRIIIKPSASVTVGTNVTFTCQSKASPSNNMTYTWYKRGQKTPLAQEKKMSFIVTHNNTGWYFCTAMNKHGNQSSEEIQLLVTGHQRPSMNPVSAGGMSLIRGFWLMMKPSLSTMKRLTCQRCRLIITTDFRCDELTEIQYIQVLELSLFIFYIKSSCNVNNFFFNITMISLILTKVMSKI
ncbi:B-cell receptor CD22-like [Paramisgurnus dabryanus]|uniref:B-cell receptor CD22-like n=1 Tax=Paramisgurnus dabryanus TaxID=90735 RepID=UPI003CCF4785